MSNELLQFLFDDPGPSPMTVSELTSKIKTELELRFRSVWVEGEIVNFSEAGSGHWYFSLNDGFSQIKASCFRSTNQRVRFKPQNGITVRVRGSLTVYEPRGEYQIVVDSLKPVGEGALRLAFEQIREKLDREGLFDVALKRRLPAFPRKVGVVTSPAGAAFFDILNVLSRRARSVGIVLIPTVVQGESAGVEIIRAIRTANEYSRLASSKIDVLIVGRGGGAAEDLWAFNEEGVARAIRLSEIPIISAVGHEIDITIADMIADLRAATPSAAAEIVAQREEDIEERVRRASENIEQALNLKILAVENRLQLSEFSPVFTELPGRIKSSLSRTDELRKSLSAALSRRRNIANQKLTSASARLSPVYLNSALRAARRNFEDLEKRNRTGAGAIVDGKRGGLEILMAKLDTLSPLSVLERGFSITENEAGDIIRNSHQTGAGEKLKIRLANGKLNAEVLSTE
ncbi:MAG TPA: exodeoxyribonuclease VII large subunit [Pyrinomonadaceae bacterium]|jgi:exodeoxyribonuclease VII large subunit|nr:exodeoxyribonuclease VII large subunit [Pyrinomonadaceae bacterium]